jgi:hypothetical protein
MFGSNPNRDPETGRYITPEEAAYNRKMRAISWVIGVAIVTFIIGMIYLLVFADEAKGEEHWGINWSDWSTGAGTVVLAKTPAEECIQRLRKYSPEFDDIIVQPSDTSWTKARGLKVSKATIWVGEKHFHGKSLEECMEQIIR